jgi:hypothetical protein
VLQLGQAHVGIAEELREALPRALARVHAVARTRHEPAEEPSLGKLEGVPAASRLAYRRLLGLRAALRDRPSGEG